MGARDGTPWALWRGQGAGREQGMWKVQQRRGGNRPLWRLRWEGIWEAEREKQGWSGVGLAMSRCVSTPTALLGAHSAGTAAEARGAGSLVQGDTPELGTGAGAALESSSPTEKAFWRLMVSSSW